MTVYHSNQQCIYIIVNSLYSCKEKFLCDSKGQRSCLTKRLKVIKYIVYCILASCYIRLTLNICSFVHQCNTFTSCILVVNKHNGGHKDNTIILTNEH
jgi:hypothetical protein